MKNSKFANALGENVGVIEYEDGRSYDSKATRSITQLWVEMHMKQRENEFTMPADASIFCGTWNVNAKKQDGGLHDWILPPNQPLADVYAVGFQEIVDLNAMNVALNSGNTQQRSQFWQESIADCLQSSGTRYSVVAVKHLVGLLLCVFVKESLMSHVKDVRVSSTGVGIMGMMGNKGGVAIRLSLFDSSVCFVCAHLAAHRENVAGRNSDYKNIIERSIFASESMTREEGDFASLTAGGLSSSASVSAPSESSSLSGSVVMPRCGAAKYVNIDLTILEHDHVFWLGDLNYRIDDEYSTEEVFAKIEAKDYETLRAKDQLNLERAKNNCFQGFEEGLLTFAPTYKYQPGTDVYETRAEKKLRAPAWCDRVLWRTVNRESVKLQNYRRAALNPSDHKPVSAAFACRMRKVVETKERVVYQELINTLNAGGGGQQSLTTVPLVEVSGLTVNVDKVYYEQTHDSTVTLRNTGATIALWRFVPKVEESRVCKRWITFDQNSGLLLPGESANITLSVFVDKKTAQLLNSGRDLLEDLIILRIERSLDYHVSVTAGYERSCFGMSLEELVTLGQPVASTPLPSQQQIQQSAQNGSSSGSATANKLSIPKELWRLVDALWTGGALREKDLFNTPGIAAEVVAIRLSLDRGTELPVCSPHSVVEVLLSFVASFARPLLPQELYPTTEIDPSNMRMFCRKFLEDLPPLNYNSFVYVLSFLREVLAEEAFNRTTPSLLANACVTNMTYPLLAPDEAIQLNKDEKNRRLTRQNLLQGVVVYLLSTTSSL